MQMDDAVARARVCDAEGDTDALAELLDAHVLELYFGVPQAEFGSMLTAIPPEHLQDRPRALLAAATFLSTGHDAAIASPQFAAAAAEDPELRLWQGLSTAWRDRLLGDVTTAYAQMRGLADEIPTVSMPLDPANGMRLCVLAQAALSAVLAGEFVDALVLYERSLLIAPTGGMDFFTRGSHLRSGLIHALWGDPEVARIHRELAASVPRTSSWLEDQLDNERDLLDALLSAPDEATTSFAVALRLTYRPMSESWPLFVSALFQLGALSGSRPEARERILAIRATGLGLPAGVGFSGSVLGRTLAFDSILDGNAGRAEQEIAETDRSHWQSRVIDGLITLIGSGAGSAAVAGRIAAEIGVQTTGLRQAEQRRLGLRALAEFRGGDEHSATQTLATAAAGVVPPPIDITTAIELFSPPLARLASERIDGWPAPHDDDAEGLFSTPALRDSEVRVLAELGRGRSRSQTAAALLLSENTVKSHQRALYRKLRARNAAQAVAEGRRRGII